MCSSLILSKLCSLMRSLKRNGKKKGEREGRGSFGFFLVIDLIRSIHFIWRKTKQRESIRRSWTFRYWQDIEIATDKWELLTRFFFFLFSFHFLLVKNGGKLQSQSWRWILLQSLIYPTHWREKRRVRIFSQFGSILHMVTSAFFFKQDLRKKGKDVVYGEGVGQTGFGLNQNHSLKKFHLIWFQTQMILYNNNACKYPLFKN